MMKNKKLPLFIEIRKCFVDGSADIDWEKLDTIEKKYNEAIGLLSNWELEFDNRNLGCCGGDNCPNYEPIRDKDGNIVGDAHNHNEALKSFINYLLSVQFQL